MSSFAERRAKVRRAIGVGITVVVMGGVVAVALRKGPSPGSAAAGEPGDCITSVVEAAERGDVPAYLEAFGGELRERLEAEAAASRPPERFARSLAAGVEELKASVTRDLRSLTDDEAELVWEKVYARYTESFRVRLRRAGGRWRIVTLTPIERGPPAIPYGTPVFQEAPAPESPSGTPSRD